MLAPAVLDDASLEFGGVPAGSDLDAAGRPVLHVAAIPSVCWHCDAPIGVGDLQTVADGGIVCERCAADTE